VSSSFVPVFLIVFAAGNFLGPLVLGRLFDTVGRKPMIAGTYIGSAVVTGGMAWLFVGKALGSPWAFEAFIFGIFFLASAGASAAYLTVSEIFPMETRALAIAFFYAIGTGIGGIAGPLLFGNLISSKSRGEVAAAFLIGAGVMLAGGIVEIFFGVKAEQQSLEDIAKPLTVADAEEDSSGGDERDRGGPERRDDRGGSERTGRRRYRPGPGEAYPYWSPGLIGTSVRSRDASETLLDREIESIGRAVDEGGPVERDELKQLVGGRRWGPGRFRRALEEAVREGRIVRVGRHRYGPPE
jgi:hypothetical protein